MNIYEQYEKTFSGVSAFVICNKVGDQVGRVAFKYSEAGVVTCYAHIFGKTMTKAKASGYGYNKATVAAIDALKGQGVDLEDNGREWERLVEEKGFKVWKAV